MTLAGGCLVLQGANLTPGSIGPEVLLLHEAEASASTADTPR